MIRITIALSLFFVILNGCNPDKNVNQSALNDLAGGIISVEGTQFKDSFDRHIILSGINKVNKDKKMNYIDNDSLSSYAQLNKYGFNCICLGVIWDGVEPEPGKYDEKYLDKLEEIVIWAAQNGIYVLLDMHQDLYSVLYSDGAPEWATLTEKQLHSTVANSIREVDTAHILFIEHSYFGNSGISSGIQPLKKANGEKDDLVAYAAHAYDLSVDTKNYDNPSNSRVELIFTRINEKSQLINIPVIVGEWGALSGDSEAIKMSACFIIGLFERLGLSNTYCAYYKGIEQDNYFKNVLIRPYPQYTGGVLSNYGFNRETNLFTCTWEESPDVNASTVIYIPDIENLVNESILLNHKISSTVIRSIKDSKAAYMIIPVTGDSVTRTIEFTINKNQASFSIEAKTNR